MNDNWEMEKYLRFINYDKKQHLKFLKESQEKSTISNKLSRYSDLLVSHLDWESRDNYLELLDKFLQEKIDIGEFYIRFRERYRLSDEVKDILELNFIILSPHPKSLDFADFIIEILDACELYSPDPEPIRFKYQFDETEFCNSIKGTYLKIQNFLEEYDKTSVQIEKLIKDYKKTLEL